MQVKMSEKMAVEFFKKKFYNFTSLERRSKMILSSIIQFHDLFNSNLLKENHAEDTIKSAPQFISCVFFSPFQIHFMYILRIFYTTFYISHPVYVKYEINPFTCKVPTQNVPLPHKIATCLPLVTISSKLNKIKSAKTKIDKIIQ